MKKFILFAALAVIAGASITWLYSTRKPRPLYEDSHAPKLPDYSGIQVNEVIVEDLQKGAGPESTAGQTLQFHYEGWIYSPAKWANRGEPYVNTRAGAPLTIKLGQGSQIQGVEEGLLGMKVGGIRRLIIPPSKAFGDHGDGARVPPGAILLAEIELVEIM